MTRVSPFQARGLYLNGEDCLSAPLSTTRMDGATFPSLLSHPGGGPLSLARCAHSTTPLDWTVATPTDQDLFELLNRLQSSRLGMLNLLNQGADHATLAPSSNYICRPRRYRCKFSCKK